MTLLPTEPLRAAELAVVLALRDQPVPDLRAACATVLARSTDSRALAHARRLADAIDRGMLV